MRAFITDANIAHLAVSLSKVGQMHTPGGIAQAALERRGQVPDGDLILACVRRWACVVNDRELQQLCDLLDNMLNSKVSS